jgi:Trypsin-like peptidase domain
VTSAPEQWQEDTGNWLRESDDDLKIPSPADGSSRADGSSLKRESNETLRASDTGSDNEPPIYADGSDKSGRGRLGRRFAAKTETQPYIEPDPTNVTDQTNAAADPENVESSNGPDVMPRNGESRSSSRQPTRKRTWRERRARKKALRRRRKLRLLPRSVLGISMLILAAGMGAAASGTALYMNYAYRKDLTDAQVKSLPESVKRWKGQLDAEGTNAQKRIQDELEPLLKQAAIGDTLARILKNAAPSVWTVRTFDVAGAASVGTAYVVASDAEKTFLLTSFDVVQSSSIKPGPEIKVSQGNDELPATLWTWQEDKDMALLIVNKGNLPRIEWAPAAETRVGTQVFAISAFGTAGGSVSNGFVADVSQSGLQHTAPVGTAFRGGPLLNEKGLVVATLSRSYAPFGFASETVWFAPQVISACEKLLKCPGGVVSGAGAQR